MQIVVTVHTVAALNCRHKSPTTGDHLGLLISQLPLLCWQNRGSFISRGPTFTSPIDTEICPPNKAIISMNRGPLWNSIPRVFTLRRRWYIVAVFWRGAVGRVGTRQESRRICHFTLGGNLSRGTIVPHNRQEVVKHIILTHWALWHGQFYCCHGWKEGNAVSRYSELRQMRPHSLFYFFRIQFLHSFSFFFYKRLFVHNWMSWAHMVVVFTIIIINLFFSFLITHYFGKDETCRAQKSSAVKLAWNVPLTRSIMLITGIYDHLCDDEWLCRYGNKLKQKRWLLCGPSYERSSKFLHLLDPECTQSGDIGWEEGHKQTCS